MGSFYEDIKKHQREIYFILAAFGIFVGIKCVIVHILPFLLAAVYVRIMERPLRFLEKRLKIGKGFLAGIFLCFILSIVLIGLWKLTLAGICQLKAVLPNISIYKRNFSHMIHMGCSLMEENLGIQSLAIENLILERAEILVHNLEVNLLPKLLGQTYFYGKAIFSTFMFLFITVIASILLAQDYDVILQKMKQYTFLEEVLDLWEKLLHTIGLYLKAQLKILLIITLICFVGFLINDYPYPYLWALITGLLDMLPFIGVAIVLLPLGVLQLLIGNRVAALVFLGTYGICALIRELLEPKLVGRSMGILPIGILISIYVGIQVFGVSGVLWGPLYLLTLFQLYKRLYH